MKSGDEKANVESLFDFFSSGGAMHMLEGISQKDMDDLWHYSCQLLENNKIKEARNILQLLVRSNHWNSDYLITLGIVCQKMNAHYDACIYLSQAARILITNPIPSWLMAYSSIALTFWQGAIELYESALLLANGKPEWEKLTIDATEQLAYCQDKLTKENEDEC
ncbi:hypothetical protein [Providencia sp. Me31A]|uniref:hypothetical protein n=1 Tax=Providencia sp. Me31A TaxID=3392637 RepID=UPI003D2B87E8